MTESPASNEREALAAVIAHFGSQSVTGPELGATQQAVSAWVRKGRIGATYVLKAEEKTGVSKHDLRPDIYPRDALVDSVTGSMEPVR